MGNDASQASKLPCAVGANFSIFINADLAEEAMKLFCWFTRYRSG